MIFTKVEAEKTLPFHLLGLKGLIGVTAIFLEFKDKIKPMLFEKLGYKNIHQVPKINKIVFDIGRKNHIFFRTLGNIIMLVPPLVISEKELNFLIDGTLKTIKDISKVVR